MWEEYFKEFLGCEIFKDHHGFIVYRELPGNSYHIEHMFVEKWKRGVYSHCFFKSFCRKAKEDGMIMITASVDQGQSKTWQESLKAQLNAGFKISAVQGNVIYTYLSLSS